MAEEEKKDAETNPEGEQPAEAGSGRKKGLLVGGGAVAVLALGAFAAFMALPGKPKVRLLKGPSVQLLFPENINVNLNESSRKRYLVFNLNGFYSSYETDYLVGRLEDPLCQPLMRHAVVRIATEKTIDDIYGKVGGSVFEEELREILDPILFPVLIGSADTPADYDEKSGLRSDVVFDGSTFRGLYHEHVIHVDGSKRTLRLDDGPLVPAPEDAKTVTVKTAAGDELSVDTTRLNEEFTGDVPVGVQGVLQQIHLELPIVQ